MSSSDDRFEAEVALVAESWDLFFSYRLHDLDRAYPLLVWQARRIAPNEVLSEGVRAPASAPSRKLRRLFVIARVALAVALLSIGGVIVEHLPHLY